MSFTSKLVALFVLVSSMMFGCVYNTYNTSNEQAAPTPSTDDAAPQSDAGPSETSTDSAPPDFAPQTMFCSADQYSLDPTGFQGCCGTFSHPDAMTRKTLVKSANSPSVFYLASDGKRYAFPSTTALASWFCPLDAAGIPIADSGVCHVCDSVQEFTNDALSAIPIGGNITFHPGTFLTGIVEFPTKFAISKGHVLRPLADEKTAVALFGLTYSNRLRYTADPVFVNYVVGTTITDPGQYDENAELKTTLEQDLGLAP